MWLVQNSNPVPTLHNRDKIEQFIDRSLLGDWSIRIEHSVGDSSQEDAVWLQWGTTLFAITSPKAVMEAIDDCHASNPSHDIRIHAEKFRPEMRMVYCVYRAAESSNASGNGEGQSVAANQDWIQLPEEKIPAKGNNAWRYVAAATTLAGTLIVWEAASS